MKPLWHCKQCLKFVETLLAVFQQISNTPNLHINQQQHNKIMVLIAFHYSSAISIIRLLIIIIISLRLEVKIIIIAYRTTKRQPATELWSHRNL